MPDAVGRALRIFSILVAVAALLAGLHGLRERAWLFRGAPLQAFSPAFRDEVSAVEARVPPGEVVLYLGTSANDWSYILWSRALYPRNDVVVRYLPLSPEDIVSVRRAWSIHHGLEFDAAPSSLALQYPKDLGALPAMPDHVFLGSVTP